MNKNNNYLDIKDPKMQIELFGYEYYFQMFVEMFNKKKLPNTILLTGDKGTGKATFVYHFINYILSKEEKNKYLLPNFTINQENMSYKNICSNIHPNVYLLENDYKTEATGIDDIRKAIKFLNKTTFNLNLKIVLIDNVENLNLNSTNALLKSLEEPDQNTYFFIINNNTNKLIETIRSRCVEFKIFFSPLEKAAILKNLLFQYKNDNVLNNYPINNFDTPGNYLRILNIIEDKNINTFNNKLLSIQFFIEKFKLQKDPFILNVISRFVELFYNELISNGKKNLSYYYNNKSIILDKINETKKFNLDKNNLFTYLLGKIENET